MMNPDVFITIVFVGIAVLVVLLGLVFVVPQIRRDDARVVRRELQRPSLTEAAASSARVTQPAGKTGSGAAVH